MHVRKVCANLARIQDSRHALSTDACRNAVFSHNSVPVMQMQAFIRELMYMPVSWPSSLCFAATFVAVTSTWEPTTCHLDNYGPCCSKSMLGRALSSTPLLAVDIFISDGDNNGPEVTLQKRRSPRSDTVSAKRLLALSDAVESITGIS